MSTARRLYEFDSFRLDPAERRLLRDGEPVGLTPKCFDLLVVLVENSGHLLEKRELLERLWPDQFIEEGSLSFNVSELRRALGEGENGRRYIETVRKKGFRFVAAVEEVPALDSAPVKDAAPSAGELRHAATGGRATLALRITLAIAAVAVLIWFVFAVRQRRSVTPAAAQPMTIAVLPFKPLTANIRDVPLEMGICNALITRLSGVEQLVVRPTSSVVTYHGMGQDPLAAGRALRVDAVLDGYIQRSQDRLQATVRLLRTADGKSLWSGQFNEDFTDIFSVEDSISRQIVEALHVKLTQDEKRRVVKHSTENVEAYDLYLKGLYFQDKRTPEGVAKSIEYFQAATAKDPRYAAAFAGLAGSYVVLAVRADMPPKASYLKADEAAMRALELDSTLAEAHSALGNIKTWFEWDWAGAEREFKRANDLGANNPLTEQAYASYLTAVGRQHEAVAAIRRAQRLAPLSLTTNVQAARILFFAGQYDAAMKECRDTLDLDPDFGGAHLFLGRIYAQERRYSEALGELERARTLLRNSAEVTSLIGYTCAVSGRKAQAQQVLQELLASSRLRYVSPYHIAMVHAGLGERDAAFEWLEKAYGDREGRMTIIRYAPEFAPLRSDPRFTDLLRRMKLPAVVTP